jgi:molecular chaperone DnaK
MDSAFEALQNASHGMAQAMYQSEQTSGPQGAGPEAGGRGASGSAKSDEDVVDAEFTEH